MLSLMGFLGRLRLVAKLLQLIRAATVSSISLLPVTLQQLLVSDEEMDTSDLDGPIGSTLRNAQRNREPGEDIVEIIILLAKKVTRRQTYYKVEIMT